MTLVSKILEWLPSRDERKTDCPSCGGHHTMKTVTTGAGSMYCVKTYVICPRTGEVINE